MLSLPLVVVVVVLLLVVVVLLLVAVVFVLVKNFLRCWNHVWLHGWGSRRPLVCGINMLLQFVHSYFMDLHPTNVAHFLSFCCFFFIFSSVYDRPMGPVGVCFNHFFFCSFFSSSLFFLFLFVLFL